MAKRRAKDRARDGAMWLMYYGAGLTFREIGSIVGLSTSRVQTMVRIVDREIARAADVFLRTRLRVPHAGLGPGAFWDGCSVTPPMEA